MYFSVNLSVEVCFERWESFLGGHGFMTSVTCGNKELAKWSDHFQYLADEVVRVLWPFTNSKFIFLSLLVNKCESRSVMSNSATPWTVACQTPLSMWFSRQENWSGLPFLLERIFPSQGSNPGLLHCRQILYRLRYQGSPIYSTDIFILLNMNILLLRIVSNAKVQ